MMNKVVVLLASFNGEKYINHQIASILMQKHVEVKLLIRDDGSTDGTVGICKNWASKDSRVSVLEVGEPTGTPAGNFYKLLMELEGNVESYDFVALADQDDIWEDIKLSSAIEKIGHNGIAYSSNLIAYSEGGEKTWIVKKNGKQKKFDFIFQGASAGCTYVFRYEQLSILNDIFRKIKFEVLKHISHDWLIYAIIRSGGGVWIMDDAAYIFYRQHKNNNYGDRRGLKLIESKISLVRSGWYFGNIRKIYNLTLERSGLYELNELINNVGKRRYIKIYRLLNSRRSVRESLAVMMFYLISKK